MTSPVGSGGVAAFRAGSDLVSDADVGERSAHHHFVVTPAGTVGVEVLRLTP